MTRRPITKKEDVRAMLDEAHHRSLDYVSIAEHARLLYACGGGVFTRETAPAEVTEYLGAGGPAELARLQAGELDEDGEKGYAPLVKISQDGSRLSAEWGKRTEGKLTYASSSTSGYRGHDFWRYVGPETIIEDWRPVAFEAAAALAVMGPMTNPDLDDGAVSRFDVGAVSPALVEELARDPLAQLVIESA